MSMFGRKKRRNARFAKREPLSIDAIFEQYYSRSAIDRDDFTYLWHEISSELGLDETLLRPTDSFNIELRAEPGTELLDEIQDLTAYVRAEASIRGLVIDVFQLHNLNDVIMFLVRRK